MGYKEIYHRVKNNHLLLMVVCCLAPLFLLLGAVYFLGLSRSYLFWFVLLLCPLTHYFMMKHMHNGKKEGKEITEEGNTEGRKKCH